MVVAGVTVMDGVVAPFDQRYDTPPEAVSVTATPAHVDDGPLIEATGAGLNVIVFDAVFGHPAPLVTVTL